MTKETVLVIGASGQIGTELVMNLRAIYSDANVVASDIKSASQEVMETGPFEQLDIMDESRLHEIVNKHKITQIYLLAALLSATAEKHRARLGLKHALVISCARLGETRQNKKDFLAELHCCFRTYNTQHKDTSTYYYGAKYCLWYI